MIIVSSKSVYSFVSSILSVLTYFKHNCLVWDDNKSFFDMIDELNPDIIFLHPNESNYLTFVDKSYSKKVIFVGFGESQIEPRLWLFPINTPKDILNKVKNYYEMPINLDIAKISNGEYNELYDYDLVYFSDNIDEINKYKNEIIYFSTLDYKFAIFGEHKVPLPQYLGNISIKTKADILASCKIGLSYNILSSMEFYWYKKPTLIHNQDVFFLQKLLESEDKRDEIGNKYYNMILNQNLTSFHITSVVLLKLDYKDLSNRCLNYINNLVY